MPTDKFSYPAYLFTEEFFWKNRAKALVKRLIGRANRGPQAVAKSLTDGLRQVGANFSVNLKPNKNLEVAGVLSNTQVLKWAIEQKKQGKIKKIVAGPNLVVGAEDEGGLIKNPLIDIFVVPSPWVRDYYASAVSALAAKIRIWPAGVELPQIEKGDKPFDFLVYNKIGRSALTKSVLEFLTQNKYKFTVLEYGQFKQAEYFSLLAQCRFEIYLSESESQGLAMFEAWARNIPTLVWERGFWQTEKYYWQGMTASPYLSDKAGMRFADFAEFQRIFREFVTRPFSPRDYVSENFTNAICAKKYLEILNG